MPDKSQRVAAAIGLCLGCVPIVSPGDESSGEPSRPDMELIEFLGTWETDDGEWVDPMVLKEIDDEALRELKNSEEGAADEHDGNEDRGGTNETSDRDPEEKDQ